jgi:hypothetical protein
MQKEKNLTSNILMVRPANFGYNEETATNNAFQQKIEQEKPEQIKLKALNEFDAMVSALKLNGINVWVVDDSNNPIKPDAVFPNNWISFHENGTVITYPMFAPNRRMERRDEIIHQLENYFRISNRYSLEFYEEEGLFLEGTGSMVFDRANKLVYACLSERTDATIMDKFNVLMGTRSIIFNATDKKGLPIYHTNVVMAMGIDFVVICMECIQDQVQKKILMESFKQTGKRIIDITFEQMENFAGNMLEVINNSNKRILVLSKTAFDALDEFQKKLLSETTHLLPIAIPTIEKYGGGSVRCMMAEVFLPLK